jgi:hypothetical protein
LICSFGGGAIEMPPLRQGAFNAIEKESTRDRSHKYANQWEQCLPIVCLALAPVILHTNKRREGAPSLLRYERGNLLNSVLYAISQSARLADFRLWTTRASASSTSRGRARDTANVGAGRLCFQFISANIATCTRRAPI